MFCVDELGPEGASVVRIMGVVIVVSRPNSSSSSSNMLAVALSPSSLITANREVAPVSLVADARGFDEADVDGLACVSEDKRGNGSGASTLGLRFSCSTLGLLFSCSTLGLRFSCSMLGRRLSCSGLLSIFFPSKLFLPALSSDNFSFPFSSTPTPLKRSVKSVSLSENRIGGSCIAPNVAVLSITGDDEEDEDDRVGLGRLGVIVFEFDGGVGKYEPFCCKTGYESVCWCPDAAPSLGGTAGGGRLSRAPDLVRAGLGEGLG